MSQEGLHHFMHILGRHDAWAAALLACIFFQYPGCKGMQSARPQFCSEFLLHLVSRCSSLWFIILVLLTTSCILDTTYWIQQLQSPVFDRCRIPIGKAENNYVLGLGLAALQEIGYSSRQDGRFAGARS